MYSDSTRTGEWRERSERVLHVAFVVACYLIVFAGLLYGVATRAGTP